MCLSPETSLEIQTKMGVDIAMAFDECPAYGISHAEVEKSMEMTHRRAKRSLEARDLLGERRGVEGGRAPALFGIVQGGIHHDLRVRSVEAISGMPFDVLRQLAQHDPIEAAVAVAKVRIAGVLERLEGQALADALATGLVVAPQGGDSGVFQHVQQ